MGKRRVGELEEALEQPSLKMAKLLAVEGEERRERGGYGRQVEASKATVVEIYKEEVEGARAYRCPFCDTPPLGSDIRFRKHLKLHHPQQKTLLREGARPAHAANLEVFFPKPLLERVEGMVEMEEKEDGEVKGELVVMEEEEENEEEYYILPDARGGKEEEDLASLEARQPDSVYTIGKAEARLVEAVVVGEEVCEVCGAVCGAGEAGSGGEEVGKVVEGVLATTATILCNMCQEVALDISKTKESIRKLQRRLAMAVGRLADLASLGRRVAEEDLLQGGLGGGGGLAVRVVEEGRLEAAAAHLGLTVVGQYRGKLLGRGEPRGDDGSRPEVVGEGEGGAGPALYLSQGEWARGGLGVREGRVEVPRSLVAGLGADTGDSRVLVSRALTADLARPYFCLECAQGFLGLGDLAEHVASHHQAPPAAPPCFDGGFAMAEVREGVKAEERVEQALIRDLNHTDKYRIELRRFMHREQFQDCRHEQPSLERPFQCKECSKTFARAHDLWGHHASYRGPAFKCNFGTCEEVFLRLPDFAVHYAAHGGQRLLVPEGAAEKKVLHITCPICQTVVPGLYKLQRHKMKHDPELKYKCPACPKQFVKANTLRAHITNVHKGSKPQKKCKKCDATVFSDNGLLAHMKAVHGEEGHGCSACGEVFLQETLLKAHLLTHTGAKREPAETRRCPECESALPAGGSLAAHFAAAHSGAAARYQCSECSGGQDGAQERFLTLEGARRHYRWAHRARPHTCYVCKTQSFGREAALHLHLATEHSDVVGEEGEVPAQCRYCSLVLPSHMERVAHTRHQHMVETIDITSTELDEVSGVVVCVV